MSAAHRGGERIAADNYPTPPWCTRRILEALWPDGLGGLHIVEPCAGEGAIVRVALEKGATGIVGGDIREMVWPWLDNLAHGATWDATQPIAERFDLLITNPPFSLAAEIITAQRDTARVSAYLLRSSFKLEGELSDKRPYSFRADMPDVYQLPERPSFVASDRCVDGERNGMQWIACGWAEKVPLGTPKPDACPVCTGIVRRSTSDASEYAWFVWGPQRRSEGRLILLPSTPLAERKAGM